MAATGKLNDAEECMLASQNLLPADKNFLVSADKLRAFPSLQAVQPQVQLSAGCESTSLPRAREATEGCCDCACTVLMIRYTRERVWVPLVLLTYSIQIQR